MDAVLLGWIATAYLLAAAMFLVPVGKIADIHGRKRIYIYGITLDVVASLLGALAPSGILLIGFRVLQGIGGAMIFGTGVAILTSVFPPGERGRALGLNVAAVYTGLSLGPFVGGSLTVQLGWRSIFWVNVALGSLALTLAAGKLRGEWAEARGERLDLTGALIYALALVAIMYGISLLPAFAGAGLLSLGLLVLVIFVRWEARVNNPLVNINLFRRNTVFAFSNLSALINYSATFAVGFLLSLYLQYIQDLSAQQAGLILVAQPVMQAVFSPFAGRLSDRVESRIIASAGMALTTLGLVLLTFLNAGTPTTFIVASLILLGLGFALFSSPNTNAIMSSVERRFYGVAAAMVGTMRLVGQMLSIGIATLLFALFIGRVQITPQYYGAFIDSVKTAFMIFAILCFGGIFASLARGQLHRQPLVQRSE
jgi:MFS family permease